MNIIPIKIVGIHVYCFKKWIVRKLEKQSKGIYSCWKECILVNYSCCKERITYSCCKECITNSSCKKWITYSCCKECVTYRCLKNV